MTVTKSLGGYEINTEFMNKIGSSLTNVRKHIHVPEFPTVYKWVDVYFNENMNRVIDRYDLMVENELRTFDLTLTSVEKNLMDMECFKDTSEKRVSTLEKDTSSLEKVKKR